MHLFWLVFSLSSCAADFSGISSDAAVLCLSFFSSLMSPMETLTATQIFGAGGRFANVALRVICSVEGNAAADGVPHLALFLPPRLAVVYWCLSICWCETRLEWAGTGRRMFHVHGCLKWSHWEWRFANACAWHLRGTIAAAGLSSERQNFCFCLKWGLQRMQSWELSIKFTS